MSFLAGVGVSSLATFLLAFCHPLALDPADLAAHLAAILVVTGLMVNAARRAAAENPSAKINFVAPVTSDRRAAKPIMCMASPCRCHRPA